MPLPPNIPLHELDEELFGLSLAITDQDGEITDEQNAAFDAILDQRDKKITGYVALIRNFELNADALAQQAKAIEAEVKRLKAGAEAKANVAQRLKDRLEQSMALHGDDAYETGIGRVRRQRSASKSIVLQDGVDVSEVPAEFLKEPALDKTALRSAYEEGDSLALRYGRIEETERFYIRIY